MNIIQRYSPSALLYGVALCVVLLLSGCATLSRQGFAPAGYVLDTYAQEELTPYLMTTEDVDMACALGRANSNLLISFERVISSPNKTGLSALFAAGLCAQAKAFEADLRYQRMLRENNASEAQDAQIRKTFFLRQAAHRQYRAYQRFTSEYGEPGGECPVFQGKRDRFFYLMGILSGVQAANNDFASGRSVGVSPDTLQRTARGSTCLDSGEWWGVPRALRAAAWTIVPGLSPDDVDPWEEFDKAIETGDQQGVRLAHAFQVLAADNKGRTGMIRETISDAVESRDRRAAPEKYSLLDAVAFQQMRHVSDRMWTEATGHRTPTDRLGTFWDEEPDEEEQEKLDKLLP